MGEDKRVKENSGKRDAAGKHTASGNQNKITGMGRESVSAARRKEQRRRKRRRVMIIKSSILVVLLCVLGFSIFVLAGGLNKKEKKPGKPPKE